MEIKELWEDIVTVKTEELLEYFLGQLVVHDAVENDCENQKYIIYDNITNSSYCYKKQI